MDAAPALEETSQSIWRINEVGSVRLTRFQGSLQRPHQAFPSFSFAVSRQSSTVAVLGQNLVLRNRLQEGIGALVVNTNLRVSARKLPPTKREKLVKTSDGQHSDGIIGFHKCRGSLHCRKTKSAAKMLTMFIVTITNHSTTTIHLWTTIRSNVTAKDVLPRVHAMIARLSPILHKRATWMRLFGVFWTISRCCPKPRFAATWQTAAYATRQHYQGIKVSKIISSQTVTKKRSPLRLPQLQYRHPSQTLSACTLAHTSASKRRPKEPSTSSISHPSP